MRMMVGRTARTAIQAQFPALQAALSTFVEYTSTRDNMFGGWLDLA